MATIPAAVMTRLDELIELGSHVGQSRSDAYYADPDGLIPWRAAAVAWLERVLGREDAYTRQFAEAADGWQYRAVTSGTAILRHVKEDLEVGYLQRVSQLIAAELVADVWGQAAELLGQGYKDAAASVGGAALEVGLRQAAAARNVAVSGTGIGPVNLSLAKAAAYSAMRQKQVDVWRELRNAAAHGSYTTYGEAEVRAMLQGGQELLAELL